MAYLVTGGTGYIGSYVARDLLRAGKQVVCLQRSGVTPVFREVMGNDDIGKIKLVQADVSNPVQLFNTVQQNDISVIIHLGYLMPPTCELQPGYGLQINCVGMSNVLEAARLFGLKRIVWSSAGHAIGRVSEFYSQPIKDDNAMYMPDSMYGAAKVLNEFMARHYHDSFGVDSIGFRLQQTFGIGRTRGGVKAFTDFLEKVALDQTAPIGRADAIIGMIYVEDVSDLMVTACEVPATRTRVFNAIEGQYTNRQVAEIVHRINPRAAITMEQEPAGSTGAGHRPPRLDSTSLGTELGWLPKYGIESGLKKVINYFRQKAGMPLL